jgi:hypothetical protein
MVISNASVKTAKTEISGSIPTFGSNPPFTKKYVLEAALTLTDGELGQPKDVFRASC